MKELSFKQKIDLLNKIIKIFKDGYVETGICGVYYNSIEHNKLDRRYDNEEFPELINAIEYYLITYTCCNSDKMPFNIISKSWLWSTTKEGNIGRIEFLTNIKVMLLEEHRLGNIK